MEKCDIQTLARTHNLINEDLILMMAVEIFSTMLHLLYVNLRKSHRQSNAQRYGSANAYTTVRNNL